MMINKKHRMWEKIERRELIKEYAKVTVIMIGGMEKRFDEEVENNLNWQNQCCGCPGTICSEPVKQFLATALEEQKAEMMKKVVELNKKWGAVPNDFRHWHQELVESLNGTEAQ